MLSRLNSRHGNDLTSLPPFAVQNITNAATTRKRRAILIFLIAVALTTAVVVETYRSVLQHARQDTLVHHSYEVKLALRGVLRVLDDAETGQRGYLLTGASEYLEPYQNAVTQIPQQLSLVANLTRDNPAQSADASELRRLSDAKLAELQETIDLYRAGKRAEAQRIVLSGVGKQRMDEARQVVARAESKEDRLLAIRISGANRARLIAIACALAILPLCLAMYYIFLQLTQAVGMQAELLNAANEAVIAADLDERITYWNLGAERLYGWSEREALGKIPHRLLRTEFPIPFEEIARQCPERGWEGELVQTKRDGSKVTVASRWIRLRDKHGKMSGWVKINTDISEQKRAEQLVRSLSGELLQVRDEERRSVAREMHDSLGQKLALLSMNTAKLQRGQGKLDSNSVKAIHENAQLIFELSQEVRTISYLLHPPLLDELGLVAALKEYVNGFSERSEIQTTLELPPSITRFPPQVEISIFRIVQECLTNVHRHSGSKTASVRVTSERNRLTVEIKDSGRGISPDESERTSAPKIGVGIRGMRERVRQLGGVIEIQSNGKGTRVTATLPLAESEGSAATTSDDRREPPRIARDARGNLSGRTVSALGEKPPSRTARA